MNWKISKILFVVAVLSACSLSVKAQVEQFQVSDTIIAVDSVRAILSPEISSVPDSTIQAVLTAADSLSQPKISLKTFQPSSKKALLYSIICPGLGQIYNRKYWKLPLVYGGFMGFLYAVTWNNKNYGDYSTAYHDIMIDYSKIHDKETGNPDYNGPWGSWTNFLPAGTGTNEKEWVNNTNFQDNLKRRKDYFRRYRDLSIILTAGWYFICMIDAYVDAELFDFDISPDLSMRVEPLISPQTSYSSRIYGVSCNIKF